MSSEGGSFSHISFHVGADWRAVCHTYDTRAPILSVDAGRCSVSISIKDNSADKSAVEFARALVRQAQAFAAEVERIHAQAGAVGDKAVNATAA
jgi:hypothetical protein